MSVHQLMRTSALSIAFILSACGGGGSGSGSSTPPPTGGGGNGGGAGGGTVFVTELETAGEAGRFVIQAGLGKEMDDINRMIGMDAATWIQTEFNKSRTDILTPVVNDFLADNDIEFNEASNQIWKALFTGDDELRLRMTFALSQIFVISDFQVGQTPLSTAYYADMLSQNAFGNYRDLMEDVTYSAAMADFLTYMRNRKGDPDTGRVPDENYARELLQLFTIGLIELNMDGTPKLTGGEPVETYDNDDIRGLARVFTGIGLDNGDFYSYSREAHYRPLMVYDEYHSDLEKTFLGQTVPANTGGAETIDQALDIIFDHPNVPPFVARQLIQRFTASNPEPAYVERVATAFANGTFTAPNGDTFGDGRRGSLQATLAAILLDETVHGDTADNTEQAGKIREPVLKLIHVMRAFGVSNVNLAEEWILYDTSSPGTALGQHPFRPKSVFNFYRPGFVAPGTQAGEAGMTTPEFQVINEGAVVGYNNFMTHFIYDLTGGQNEAERFTPDYSEQMPLANSPQDLVNHMDVLLTGGQMTTNERSAIREIISAMETNDASEQALERVRIAALMVTATPSFGIIE